MELLQRLGLSLFIGLLIGAERGWQERSATEGERVAGIRTFGFLGLLGGLWALLRMAKDGLSHQTAVHAIVLASIVNSVTKGFLRSGGCRTRHRIEDSYDANRNRGARRDKYCLELVREQEFHSFLVLKFSARSARWMLSICSAPVVSRINSTSVSPMAIS